jgi:hypothetical protein
MNLNDLLRKDAIDPTKVVVLRHRPYEPDLRKILPWLAEEKPELYNAYQQTQGQKLEGVLQSLVGAGFVASFIGHEPGKALFVGLYAIVASRPITFDEYWASPAHAELKGFGMIGWSREKNPRDTCLWFELDRTQFQRQWQGKLVVEWPPPERSWWRRSHRNELSVLAVHEESALSKDIAEWNELELSWKELSLLPSSWKAALQQWRGIYFIFDSSDGKGYVGSAYGKDNLLGRWLNYGASGHGGNVLLRKRDPANLHFSILQLTSPNADSNEVIGLETSWKHRLHTHAPHGLNEN